MAKAKRRYNSSKKVNNSQISRPSKDEDEIRRSKIIPLIQKLTAAESADRLLALSTMTSIAEDAYLRLLLKKEKVLPIIIDSVLKDSSEEIVAEAYGLLRNFVVEEGYDLAIYLFRQGILTQAQENLIKLQSVLSTGIENASSAVLDCTENILGLLAAMVPTDDQIFETVNHQFPGLPKLLEQLLSACKDSKIDNFSLLETVAEFTYIMTEANRPFTDSLQQVDFVSLTSSKYASVRAYAVGVLYNRYIEEKLHNGQSDDNLILSCLNVLISVINAVDLTQAHADIQSNAKSTDNPKQANDFAVLSVRGRSAINAVQTSLELIAAISEALDVNAEGINETETAEDLIAEDEEMDDTEFIDSSVHFEDDIKFDSEPVTKNTPNEIINYLIETVIPCIINVWSDASCSSRAFSAMNNIIWSLSARLSISYEPYRKTLETIWQSLIPQLTIKFQDIETLISITGSLWGIAKAFDGQVPVDEITTNGRKLDLVSFIIDVQYPEVKTVFPESEWVKYSSNSISLLAIIASRPDQIEVTKKIAVFLFSVVNNLEQTLPIVMVDVLNAIFDIFGDKEYSYDEELFVNAGSLQILMNALPSARKITKKVNKKTDRKLRQVCDQACINLARFIDYKQKERA